MAARILIHVQHLLGTGHLKRAAAIAAELATHHRVEIASGGPPLANLRTGKARLVQLPPLRATDASFRRLVNDAGNVIDPVWKAARAAALLQTFQALRPDVLITELFPFGRRNLEFELLPLLEAARAATPRPLILCSLRDILVPPGDPAKVTRAIDRARSLYDRVLVHGDPALIPLTASYPAAAAIADRLVYTGYVTGVATPSAPPGEGNDEIVVSVGGGAVGARLLKIAAQAQQQAGGGRRWRLLVGADTPPDTRATLAAAAGPGLIVEPVRADFIDLLRRSHVSISQAGYNTAMDILDARARAVLVPFATDGETEQSLRARAMAARGWAAVLDDDALNPRVLADAVAGAGRRPRPDSATLRRNGAAETARQVTAMLAERSA